jgi:GntR family transcriptional regulator
MNKVYQLSNEVTLRIVREMRSGIFSAADRLPPEVELAQSMGVSRNIIRECLARLEQEGMVSRRHGVGTLINRHIISTEFRLDLNAELMPTIEHTGRRARTVLTGLCRKKASAEYAEKLELNAGEDLIVSDRIIYADEIPVVYCVDYIPAASVKDTSYTEEDFQPSVFAFLKRFCGTELEMDLAEIRALAAPKKIAESLKISPGTPLLCLEDIGFDSSGKPVLFSKVYFIDRIIRHVILRKKI